MGSPDDWFLAVAIGLSFQHQFVGGGLEPVDGRLGEERVGHEPEPLDGFPIRVDDGGGGSMSLHHKFIDVGSVGRVEGLEAEVV